MLKLLKDLKRELDNVNDQLSSFKDRDSPEYMFLSGKMNALVDIIAMSNKAMRGSAHA